VTPSLQKHIFFTEREIGEVDVALVVPDPLRPGKTPDRDVK
jgi:hypothetical protein